MRADSSVVLSVTVSNHWAMHPVISIHCHTVMCAWANLEATWCMQNRAGCLATDGAEEHHSQFSNGAEGSGGLQHCDVAQLPTQLPNHLTNVIGITNSEGDKAIQAGTALFCVCKYMLTRQRLPTTCIISYLPGASKMLWLLLWHMSYGRLFLVCDLLARSMLGC